MAFTWTEKSKKVGPQGFGLEAETRRAVIVAVEQWLALPDGERPTFNGGRFADPTNAAASAIVDACTAHLGTEIAGRARAGIITTAALLARVACGTGLRGGDAWKKLAEAVGGAYTPDEPPAPALPFAPALAPTPE